MLRETKSTIARFGEAPFMTWLDDRGREAETVTFAGLWESSRRVARKMVDDWGVETGDRVLLCYLPGTAFMVAFWGCLRLRVVAVPVYPPDPSKLAVGLKKLALVKKSCSASLCLTERALDQMRNALGRVTKRHGAVKMPFLCARRGAGAFLNVSAKFRGYPDQWLVTAQAARCR